MLILHHLLVIFVAQISNLAIYWKAKIESWATFRENSFNQIEKAY